MTTSNSTSAPSYFETVTGKPVNPVWLLRAFPAAALVCVLLATFVWKTGNAHGVCLGLAAGTLIGLIAQTFAITRVEVRNDPQRSDVDNLSITR
jgi:Na+/proline symporter